MTQSQSIAAGSARTCRHVGPLGLQRHLIDSVHQLSRVGVVKRQRARLAHVGVDLKPHDIMQATPEARAAIRRNSDVLKPMSAKERLERLRVLCAQDMILILLFVSTDMWIALRWPPRAWHGRGIARVFARGTGQVAGAVNLGRQLL